MDSVIVFITFAVGIVIFSFTWHRTGRKSHSNYMEEQIKIQRTNLLSGLKNYSWSEVDEILNDLLKENDV